MKKLRTISVCLIFLVLLACSISANRIPWKIDKNKESVILLLTDIHFDPFTNGEALKLLTKPLDEWDDVLNKTGKSNLPDYGEDTNYRLFSSALGELKFISDDIDCAIICGDLMCHNFDEKFKKYCGSSSRCTEFAIKTIEYEALSLQQALPGKPIYFVIGNNDSDNGNYNIKPGGEMLKELSIFFKTVSKDSQASIDFATGGYYAITFPFADNEELIVLNDVYWHEYYKSEGEDENVPENEIQWLKNVLDNTAADGKKAIIAMHIPPGIDAYLASKDKHCIGNDGFLKQRYSSELMALLNTHNEVLEYMFAGHTHFDDFRVFSDKKGIPFFVADIIPSISPVHGNNPAFELALIGKNGQIEDKAVYNLVKSADINTEAEWKLEYTFDSAFDYTAYSPENLYSLADSINKDQNVLNKFLLFYTAGNDSLSKQIFNNCTAYKCVLKSPDDMSYTFCACGKQ